MKSALKVAGFAALFAAAGSFATILAGARGFANTPEDYTVKGEETKPTRQAVNVETSTCKGSQYKNWLCTDGRGNGCDALLDLFPATEPTVMECQACCEQSTEASEKFNKKSLCLSSCEMTCANKTDDCYENAYGEAALSICNMNKLNCFPKCETVCEDFLE